MAKRIITEADVYKAQEAGSSITAPPGECIVTPKARDKALELNVSIIEDPATQGAASQAAPPSPTGGTGDASRPQKENALISEVISMMRAKLPAGISPKKLEEVVRDVVAAKSSQPAAGKTEAAAPSAGASDAGKAGVFFVDNQRLMDSHEGPKPVPGQTIMAEALGASEKLPMSAGYMQWEKSSFNRTMECVEICVILEGKLHLTVGGENMIGKPGDMIYLPKGVKVIYSAPEKVKLACINCLDQCD